VNLCGRLAGCEIKFRRPHARVSDPRFVANLRTRLRAADHPFDARVRDQPQQGHQQINRARYPRIDKCEQNAGNIEHRRNLALDVMADGSRQRPLAALGANDHPL